MELGLLVIGLLVGGLLGVLWARSSMARATAASSAAAAAEVAAERLARERAEASLQAMKEHGTTYEQTAKVVSQEVLAETTKRLREEFEQQRKVEKELAERALDQRRKSIDDLVKPVRDKLAEFDKKVSDAEEKRAKLDGAFSTKLDELGLSVDLLGTRTTTTIASDEHRRDLKGAPIDTDRTRVTTDLTPSNALRQRLLSLANRFRNGRASSPQAHVPYV